MNRPLRCVQAVPCQGGFSRRGDRSLGLYSQSSWSSSPCRSLPLSLSSFLPLLSCGSYFVAKGTRSVCRCCPEREPFLLLLTQANAAFSLIRSLSFVSHAIASRVRRAPTSAPPFPAATAASRALRLVSRDSARCVTRPSSPPSPIPSPETPAFQRDVEDSILRSSSLLCSFCLLRCHPSYDAAFLSATCTKKTMQLRSFAIL